MKLSKNSSCLLCDCIAHVVIAGRPLCRVCGHRIIEKVSDEVDAQRAFDAAAAALTEADLDVFRRDCLLDLTAQFPEDSLSISA